MFLKDVPRAAPIAASITAIIVHFTMYFGKVGIPFSQSSGENPGVAAAVAILTSVLVGTFVYLINLRRIRVQA
jgi:sodium/pantothenate symporter